MMPAEKYKWLTSALSAEFGEDRISLAEADCGDKVFVVYKDGLEFWLAAVVEYSHYETPCERYCLDDDPEKIKKTNQLIAAWKGRISCHEWISRIVAGASQCGE